MRQKLRSHVTFANVVSLIALSVALGGTTYAATGGNFILGQSNSAGATTSLTSGTTGPALKLTNTNSGTGAKALALNVASGHTPFSVNSATKVTNLNADKLDGKDITNWDRQGVRTIEGPLTISFAFNSPGGRLLIMASGSGYRSSADQSTGLIGMDVKVDGTSYAHAEVFTNEADSHRAFVPVYIDAVLSPGIHQISLEALHDSSCGTSDTTDTLCTTTDSSDRFSIGFVGVP
jgi:hypothetical protein